MNWFKHQSFGTQALISVLAVVFAILWAWFMMAKRRRKQKTSAPSATKKTDFPLRAEPWESKHKEIRELINAVVDLLKETICPDTGWKDMETFKEARGYLETLKYLVKAALRRCPEEDWGRVRGNLGHGNIIDRLDQWEELQKWLHGPASAARQEGLRMIGDLCATDSKKFHDWRTQILYRALAYEPPDKPA
ncbi:MAG: hypothetical protein HW405_453 [Candidatus Berkelbacteria bacterium]|nr:hypothetical protein [Candidatus Berkelbacteria bacterium]